MLNEAGSIREVVDVIMTYERHSERILLAVTRLGKQSMILGFTWLDKHNPEIDFRARSVKMTRCLPLSRTYIVSIKDRVKQSVPYSQNV